MINRESSNQYIDMFKTNKFVTYALRGWAYVAAVLVLASSFSGFLFLIPQSVEAAGEQYVYRYDEQNTDLIKDLQKAFKDKDFEADTLDNDSTRILVRGGIFGEEQFMLKYSADYSVSNKDLASKVKETGFKEKESDNVKVNGQNPFTYHMQYYCDKNSKKVTSKQPSGARYLVNAIAYVDLGPNFNKNPHKFRVAIDSISYRDSTKPNEPTPDAKNTGEINGNPLKDDQIRSSGIPRDCLPTYSATADYSPAMPNYNQLSKEEQEKWNEQAAAANSGGSGEEGGNNESPDCDAKLSSPLSWIVCPVVDMGTAFTDFVYTEFVQGLLEDVPIGTDPSNGGFLAWQQFRLLGNIILVGTLLAVVYSQARGGK